VYIYILIFYIIVLNVMRLILNEDVYINQWRIQEFLNAGGGVKGRGSWGCLEAPIESSAKSFAPRN
jgi:hypothetical protein